MLSIAKLSIAKLSKAKQSKAKQSKAKQSKAKHSKAKVSKAKQNKAKASDGNYVHHWADRRHPSTHGQTLHQLHATPDRDVGAVLLATPNLLHR